MVSLAFTPDRNHRAVDYTGAFKPEAKRFCAHFSGHPVEVSLAKSGKYQRETIFGAIEMVPGDLECVAFFCHGFTSRIQLGLNSTHAKELARRLAARGCGRVALYACSTGTGSGPGGDGGFADALRDAMCAEGLTDCRVLAHRTSGHTTQNPKKRFFDGMGSPVGGVGGYEVVAQSSALWRPWAKRIQAQKDLFRFRIMWMSVADIHKELVST